VPCLRIAAKSIGARPVAGRIDLDLREPAGLSR
jgi:hypothetical protein